MRISNALNANVDVDPSDVTIIEIQIEIAIF